MSLFGIGGNAPGTIVEGNISNGPASYNENPGNWFDDPKVRSAAWADWQAFEQRVKADHESASGGGKSVGQALEEALQQAASTVALDEEWMQYSYMSNGTLYVVARRYYISRPGITSILATRNYW